MQGQRKKKIKRRMAFYVNTPSKPQVQRGGMRHNIFSSTL
jgi:hypothetical protein